MLDTLMIRTQARAKMEMVEGKGFCACRGQKAGLAMTVIAWSPCVNCWGGAWSDSYSTMSVMPCETTLSYILSCWPSGEFNHTVRDWYFSSVNSEILITAFFHLVLSNEHAFLWMQMLINSYEFEADCVIWAPQCTIGCQNWGKQWLIQLGKAIMCSFSQPHYVSQCVSHLAAARSHHSTPVGAPSPHDCVHEELLPQGNTLKPCWKATVCTDTMKLVLWWLCRGQTLGYFIIFWLIQDFFMTPCKTN